MGGGGVWTGKGEGAERGSDCQGVIRPLDATLCATLCATRGKQRPCLALWSTRRIAADRGRGRGRRGEEIGEAACRSRTAARAGRGGAGASKGDVAGRLAGHGRVRNRGRKSNLLNPVCGGGNQSALFKAAISKLLHGLRQPIVSSARRQRAPLRQSLTASRHERARNERALVFFPAPGTSRLEIKNNRTYFSSGIGGGATC